MKKNWIALLAVAATLALGVAACDDKEKENEEPTPPQFAQPSLRPNADGVIVNDTLHISYNGKLNLDELFTIVYGEGELPTEKAKLKVELLNEGKVRSITKRGGVVVKETTVTAFALNGSRLTTIAYYPVPVVNGDRRREVELPSIRVSIDADTAGTPITLPIVIDNQPGSVVAIQAYNNSTTLSTFYRHVEGSLYRAAVGRTTASVAVTGKDFTITYADGREDNAATSEDPVVELAGVDFGTGVVQEDGAKVLKYPGTDEEPTGYAGYILAYPIGSDTNDVATYRLDVKAVKLVGVAGLTAEQLADGTAARTFLVRAAGVTTANHPNRLLSGFLNGVFDDGYQRAFNAQDNGGVAINTSTVSFSTDGWAEGEALEGQTAQAALGANAFRALRLNVKAWTSATTDGVASAVGAKLTFTISPENHYDQDGWRVTVQTEVKAAP
jgi:hypothetical protein